MTSPELRRRAEAMLRERKKTAPLTPTTKAEAQRLVHELQVHQIELEMQNEALQQARADLETALRQYTDLYDLSPAGYVTLARDGAIQQINLIGARLLGVEHEAALQRRLGVFVAPASRAAWAAFLENVFVTGQLAACEVAVPRPGGAPRWVRCEAVLAEAASGMPAVCHGVLVDISTARRAQEALRRSEEHFKNLAQVLPDAVYTLDLPTHQVIYFNHDVFLGYSRAELMAEIELLSPHHLADAAAETVNRSWVLGSEPLAPLEYRVRSKAGDWEWVERREVVQARDAAGRPTQLLVLLSLITERKEAAETLRHLSIHDALTGLYNRGYFEAELARLERGREFPVSLMLADVDGLKAANDSRGHAAGDRLLQRVAQVLTAAFRSEDVVTRIGGDEFAVLLPGADAAAADRALQRVRQLIEADNAAGEGPTLRLSLGASTAESRGALAGAFTEADAAMYREKRGGRAG